MKTTTYSLPKPFFVLAPMDDVTDMVFRQMVAGCSPADSYMTEFVNVDGLQSPGRTRLLRKLRFDPSEKNLIAQLWGINPDNFRKTAEEIADGSLARELGLPDGCNFVGIDLNMGCPAKSEVQHGACSALINDRPLAKAIIDATRQGLQGAMPLSVKTRLGFHEVQMDWISFLLQQNLDMLTVHGRTRKQMSKVPADWNLIGQARQLRDDAGVATLIVGNGDVRDHAHGLELAIKHQLDGIMIGRGLFQDPFAFAAETPWESYTPKQKVDLYIKHVQLFAATWQEGERPIQTLNKFCKLYINGFDGAKDFREQLMKSTTMSELLGELSQSKF